MKFLGPLFSVWQLVCNAAQGTAPLQVTSTTVVTNLNADKVDGHDWADVPTKLSQLSNDIGAGGGVKITTATTAPTTPSPGDFWYKVI